MTKGILKADLHNHSCFSHDALTTPKSFIRTAKQKGLDAIALTDHNTTKGWKAVLEEAKKQGFLLILGEEIKVYENKKCAGEMLGLFLQELISPSEPETVLDKIREQDGIAIIAHPFEWAGRHPFRSVKKFAKRVDAIEVLNSRCLFESMNQKALEFVKKNSLTGSAGSDSHTPWEIGNAFVESKANDLEELRKAIQKGNIVVKGKRSNQFAHFFSTLAKWKLFPKL